MAETFRHAARRRSYEVRERGGEPPVDLGVRFTCSDYLAAVEYALDLLERVDPTRAGKVRELRVVAVDDGRREVVWTYEHGERDREDDDLVARWGFDVTRRWGAPAPASTRPAVRRRWRAVRPH